MSCLEHLISIYSNSINCSEAALFFGVAGSVICYFAPELKRYGGYDDSLDVRCIWFYGKRKFLVLFWGRFSLPTDWVVFLEASSLAYLHNLRCLALRNHLDGSTRIGSRSLSNLLFPLQQWLGRSHGRWASKVSQFMSLLFSNLPSVVYNPQNNKSFQFHKSSCLRWYPEHRTWRGRNGRTGIWYGGIPQFCRGQ